MTVIQQQCLLTYLGYAPGPVDGVAGQKTRAALAKFQKDAGLEATGESSEETEAALRKQVAENRQPTDWWQTVRHFRREEFRCKCGGQYCTGWPAEMKESAVRIADTARTHFGRPAHVISGLRCPQWNAHEGGVPNSQHMSGEAIDLRIEGISAKTLCDYLTTQPGVRYAYCINGENVHFDVPKGM